MNGEIEDDAMLPEYDFSGGVRGKHHRAYRRGTTVVRSKGGHGHGGSTVDVEQALKIIAEHRNDAGDGQWLETLTRDIAPHLTEWQIEQAWRWAEWPERVAILGKDSRADDDGIDVVAKRKDGGLVAIQCKARGRTEQGREGTVTGDDVNEFIAATGNPAWAERWVATTAQPSSHVLQKLGPLADPEKPVRWVVISEAIGRELIRRKTEKEWAADPRTAMQEDAIERTLKGLEALRGAKHPGWAQDESRGKTIMPCGTGKTRVGYEVSRRMAGEGLTVVMAPSIGLVRQLRLAWLEWAERCGEQLDTLSVCSDSHVTDPVARKTQEEERAGTDATQIHSDDDPTEDRSYVSASEVVGSVEKDSQGIRVWLREQANRRGRPVIFSTYQSGHQTAQALRESGTRATLLICDEAHRTAGIRKAKGKKLTERIRSFTTCHRSAEFPARTRLYMTATPRVFAMGEGRKNAKWDVHTMDDETTFGAECYRLSYRQAVEEGYISDYRIIAVMVPGSGHTLADQSARKAERAGEGKSTRATTSLNVRKLAYAMAIGGMVPDPKGDGQLPIRASIAFCNRIDRSKDMAEEIAGTPVKEWLETLAPREDVKVKQYRVEHRDSGDSAAKREEALQGLRNATPERPYGVSNVGIFGEGIDTPELNAVAFIEPRKSPVDVIQAVGRVMRRSSAKDVGYVIVPLAIPPGQNAEAWLEACKDTEGWKELGQILNALRAHDGRIERELGKLMHVVVPVQGETAEHLVVTRDAEGVHADLWLGPMDELEDVVADTTGEMSVRERLEEQGRLRDAKEAETVDAIPCGTWIVDDREATRPLIAAVPTYREWRAGENGYATEPAVEHAKEVLNEELRKPRQDRRKLRRAKKRTKEKRKSKPDRATQRSLEFLQSLQGEDLQAEAIRVNVLERSGLLSGPERDFNVLRESVEAAAARLREDELEDDLKTQLGMQRIASDGKKRADGCTVTALLLMTASIVHARIERAGSLKGRQAAKLEEVSTHKTPAEALMLAWDEILDMDYKPVFKLARDLLRHLTRQVRKTAALDAAIRGITKDAVEIADTYATMGMDHAGELFNKVMGDQAADGAYFTRPVAGVLLAELAMHACGETDWHMARTWRRATVMDPACGSGTLLMAWIAAMKRRAAGDGAKEKTLARLHKHAVEEGIVGLDINPVSLQLAGAQLTIGDLSARYEKMGLWQMPYGYGNGDNNEEPANAGSLELLTDERVAGKPAQYDPQGQQGFEFERERTYKDKVKGVRIALREDEPKEHEGLVEDVVEKVQGRRVALMNPPFVTREKLGSKFERDQQVAVRKRIDGAQAVLEAGDPAMRGVAEKTTTRPLYVALGLKCIDPEEGVLGMVVPTAGLLAPSGLRERRILAERLHIRYVLTCHEPMNINLSQGTNVNESLVIGTRARRGEGRPTCFVSLDRLPRRADEAVAVAEAIAAGAHIPEGRSKEVCAERIAAGDWSAAGWRDPALDDAVEEILGWNSLVAMGDVSGVTMRAPGHGALVEYKGTGMARQVFNSKAADGQIRIEGRPDSRMRLKPKDGETENAWEAREERLWNKWMKEYASHLLVSAGQRMQTGRLSAVACKGKHIGMRWKPVQGLTRQQAKAWAVWLNSTPGRLMTLIHRGKSLDFVVYDPAGLLQIRVPRLDRPRVIERLADAWEETCAVDVPQYRDGYTTVRQHWDEAVCNAIDGAGLERVREWAKKLNREPAVSVEGFHNAV